MRSAAFYPLLHDCLAAAVDQILSTAFNSRKLNTGPSQESGGGQAGQVGDAGEGRREIIKQRERLAGRFRQEQW